jgi:Carboxypeptidase regulatory-like domain
MRKKFMVPVLLLAALPLAAGDTTKIQIHVVNDLGKPVGNAEVIVKFEGRSIVKLGAKVRTSWEMRTTQEGIANVPGVPHGKVLIQINAHNYQTYGQRFDMQEDEKTVEVKLQQPQAQYSNTPAPAK